MLHIMENSPLSTLNVHLKDIDFIYIQGVHDCFQCLVLETIAIDVITVRKANRMKENILRGRPTFVFTSALYRIIWQFVACMLERVSLYMNTRRVC